MRAKVILLLGVILLFLMGIIATIVPISGDKIDSVVIPVLMESEESSVMIPDSLLGSPCFVNYKGSWIRINLKSCD